MVYKVKRKLTHLDVDAIEETAVIAIGKEMAEVGKSDAIYDGIDWKTTETEMDQSSQDIFCYELDLHTRWKDSDFVLFYRDDEMILPKEGNELSPVLKEIEDKVFSLGLIN